MKKNVKLLLLTVMAAALIASLCTPAFAANTAVTAAPANASIYINGALVAFDAYTINGNNYFKLRDLAKAMNGTAKQFAVGFDSASSSITIKTGTAYTPVGGELTKSGTPTPMPAAPSASKVLFNGTQINLTAYTISGNNYFKLRDIGAYANFNVAFDAAANAIKVDTSKNYLFDFTGIWSFTSGVVYNFVLAADGTVTETLPLTGTYKTAGNVINATVSGTGFTDTTVYNVTTYNGSPVLTTDSGSFPRYYKVSGGSSSGIAGTWIAYCHANGFTMAVTLKEDGTYSAEMKGVCGTVVYDDTSAFMAAGFFTGSTTLSIEAAIPYKVALDANGKISASGTINGKNVTFSKIA